MKYNDHLDMSDDKSNSPLARRTLEAAIFLNGAVMMMLEILASKLIAPFFGSSIYTWGGLIGVVLMSVALGYLLGGRLADKRKESLFPGVWMAGAGVWIVFLPAVTEPVCRWVSAMPLPPTYESLPAIVLLFSTPSILMGMSFPLALRMGVASVETVGADGARIGGISTAGGVAGTFTTIWIVVNIPELGLYRSLLLMGAAQIVAGCALELITRRPRDARTRAAFGLTAAAAAVFAARACLGPARLFPALPEGARLVEEIDSPYHLIRVIDQTWGLGANAHAVRLMTFPGSSAYQSGIFLDLPGRPAVSPVYKIMALVPWLHRPSIRRVALIGVGGGVVARDLARRFSPEAVPGLTMDLVDIDPFVFLLGERHFDLPARDPRVTLNAQDGREFFRKTPRTFQLVMLDTYSSAERIPEHLITREFFTQIRDRMSPDGLLMLNLVSAVSGGAGTDRSGVYFSVLKTLDAVFGKGSATTYLPSRLKLSHSSDPAAPQNVVVVVAAGGLPRAPASEFDRALWIPEDPAAASSYARAAVLTDEFNPIEQLVVRMRD